MMHIVTRVKSNAVAYAYPPKKERGRPQPELQTAMVTMYGKKGVVQFLCLDLDLLWGQGLYQELRFVLVQRGKQRSILVSTELTLEATDVIELYGHRFKIESMFRELKQVTGAFNYNFWRKSMPKLNRYLRKGNPQSVEQIIDEQERSNILLTIKAIEGYVMCACIVMGILQFISVHFSDKAPQLFFRYLKPP